MSDLITLKRECIGKVKKSEQDFNDARSDYHNILAAIILRRYGLKPGDLIQYQNLSRVRVENQSINGCPLGQVVSASGVSQGRTIILYEDSLSLAKKLPV